jgi:SAM-dependent methyltransferase
MSGSVAFDRAAEYYDRTRAMAPEASARLSELLAGELRGHEPVLEIGVGTGRIALPLHAAGVDLVGADISVPMLNKLVENSAGRAPFPILGADATRLPFAADSFGGALSAHVLHLITDWHRAVGELFRVLRPRSILVVDVGGLAARHGDWAEIMDRFLMESGIARRNRGVDRIDELATEMERRGAAVRSLPVVENRRRTTYAALLDHLEHGRSSFTWQLDDEARRRAARRTRAWAEERFGDTARSADVNNDIHCHAFHLP